jgi:hypothetical protein
LQPRKKSVATGQESQVIATFDIFKCKLQVRLLPGYNSKDTLVATMNDTCTGCKSSQKALHLQPLKKIQLQLVKELKPSDCNI